MIDRPTPEVIAALNDYMNRGINPRIAHILRGAGLMTNQHELTDEARSIHAASVAADWLGLRWLIGEVEVSLRPDAARAQRAVHNLVQWLETMQNDWQDVQRRVQDANDKLRWKQQELLELKGIGAPHQIGHYQGSPMRFYVLNNDQGEPGRALCYNPTNGHVFTPDETRKVIALLQVYVDSMEREEVGKLADELGIKALVGILETGLRPDAAQSQHALHQLVRWLDTMQSDWTSVQKRVQDANDKARRLEDDLKAATEAFEEVYRLAEWTADGQDEINEFTPDLIIQGLEGSLNSIKLEIAKIMARLKAHE